ncbi:hypothetical protein QUB70_29085 [Microcoleus sp. A003_D6]
MPVPQRVNFMLVGLVSGTGKMPVPQRLNFTVVGCPARPKILIIITRDCSKQTAMQTIAKAN